MLRIRRLPHTTRRDVSQKGVNLMLAELTASVAEEDAPSGMLARGHYTAISTFVDDDKHKHLEFEWSFDIAKDW